MRRLLPSQNLFNGRERQVELFQLFINGKFHKISVSVNHHARLAPHTLNFLQKEVIKNNLHFVLVPQFPAGFDVHGDVVIVAEHGLLSLAAFQIVGLPHPGPVNQNSLINILPLAHERQSFQKPLLQILLLYLFKFKFGKFLFLMEHGVLHDFHHERRNFPALLRLPVLLVIHPIRAGQESKKMLRGDTSRRRCLLFSHGFLRHNESFLEYP